MKSKNKIENQEKTSFLNSKEELEIHNILNAEIDIGSNDRSKIQFSKSYDLCFIDPSDGKMKNISEIHNIKTQEVQE